MWVVILAEHKLVRVFEIFSKVPAQTKRFMPQRVCLTKAEPECAVAARATLDGSFIN